MSANPPKVIIMTASKFAVVAFTDEPMNEVRNPVAAERVVSGDPQHHTCVFFQSEDGALVTGAWTSTPGRWHALIDREEFCSIVAGHCRLISEDGTVREFKTGDAFLVPNGFRGDWEVIETTTKHFVIRKYES